MCTVFSYSSNKTPVFIIGKNYDVKGPCKGMVFVNKRGLSKTALIMPPEIPKQWTSLYGSITFSQVGKSFPSCGMNEKGLVIEQTTLWNTLYPDQDSRPAIKELQWIQYMLDTCITVDEVISNADQVRISQNFGQLQFFICDANGNNAVIEYILGKKIVFRKNELSYPVIANDMYQTSVDYLRIHNGFGGHKPIKQSSLSLDRFVNTVKTLRQLDDANSACTNDSLISGFDILKISEFEDTKWKIIYHPQKMLIQYCTQTSPCHKTLDMKKFDFSSHSSELAKDMDQNNSESFQNFTTELNYNFAKHFFTESVLSRFIKVSDDQIRAFAQYPETFSLV